MRLMRIVTIPGSLRKGSYNRKLIALANEALTKAGVEVDAVDLKEFPLPPYDGDIEAETGLPDAAWTLKAKLAAGHGIIISSPEYNAGIPGMLKNVIDWTSRGGSNPWTGKVVGLMGATSGMWGTQRMMPQLRGVMTLLGAMVIPQQINIRHAREVWNEAGELIDEKMPERMEKFVVAFLEIVNRMQGDKG